TTTRIYTLSLHDALPISGTTKAILSEPGNLSVVKCKLGSGEKSRTRLAVWVCRRLRLRDARGKPRVSSCLKALRDLERERHFKRSEEHTSELQSPCNLVC